MSGINVNLRQNAVRVNNTLGAVFANAKEGQTGTLLDKSLTFYGHALKNVPQYVPTGTSGILKFQSAVLTPYQKVYFIPYDAPYVMIYDIINRTFDTTSIPVSSNFNKFWGGTYHKNNKIYCAPYGTEYILVIDILTNKTYEIPIPLGANQFIGCCVDPVTGYIYFCPNTANYILRLDPNDDSIDVSITTPTTISNKYGGIYPAPNGQIYLIPRSENHVLILNPITETHDNVTLSGLPADNVKWLGGSLAINEKIYCAPQNYSAGLIVDTKNNTYDIASLAGIGIDYFGAIAAPNNTVYFCPSTLNQLAIIDINTDTYTTTTVTAPLGWSGFCLDNIGNVIGAPRNSSNMLSIPTGIPSSSLDWHVSLYRNRW